MENNIVFKVLNQRVCITKEIKQTFKLYLVYYLYNLNVL